MNAINLFGIGWLVLSLTVLSACDGSSRPGGEEVKAMLNVFNQSYRQNGLGNFEERYNMYASSYLKQFEQEVQMAIQMDSVSLTKLPPPLQLRVLGMRNGLDKGVLLSGDTKNILRLWDTSSRRNFPVSFTFDRVYTPKPKLEQTMLEEGAKVIHVLFVEEDGKLKIDPLNSAEIQQKRHDNLLQRYELQEMLRYACWQNYKDTRRINWHSLQ